MFETLTQKLGAVFDKLKRRGALTEGDVDAALRELPVQRRRRVRAAAEPDLAGRRDEHDPDVGSELGQIHAADLAPDEAGRQWVLTPSVAT